MKLSQLIEAWDILHIKDVGEMGFCDLDKALTKVGVTTENDIPNEQPSKISEAMDVLKKYMADDSEPGSYAHSWHCNIAMMCYDAIMSDDYHLKMLHEDALRIGNDAASRFMRLCFDVETKQ